MKMTESKNKITYTNTDGDVKIKYNKLTGQCVLSYFIDSKMADVVEARFLMEILERKHIKEHHFPKLKKKGWR